MMRKIGTLALVAGLGTAPAAFAEEHIISIVGYDYFPEITYVMPGDVVHFVNETGSGQRVYSKSRNGSAQWGAPENVNRVTLRDDGTYAELDYTIDGIVCDPDECFSLDIVPGVDFAFSNNYYYDNANKRGTLQWGPAPDS